MQSLHSRKLDCHRRACVEGSFGCRPEIPCSHELFHLLTRQNSNFKKDIYKVIGFTVIEKEIIFPSDLAEIRISNPDISRYDSYGTFTIGGQKQYCTMVIYTDRLMTEKRSSTT